MTAAPLDARRRALDGELTATGVSGVCRAATWKLGVVTAFSWKLGALGRGRVDTAPPLVGAENPTAEGVVVGHGS